MEIFTNIICYRKKIIGEENIDELLSNLNNPELANLKKDTDDMLNMIQNLSTVEQDPDNNSSGGNDLPNILKMD